jgi:hypothetical protein
LDKVNLITACSRPNNLKKIERSINIPKDYYNWIIVFDLNELPNLDMIPEYCDIYTFKNKNSIVGNAQRNYALDLIKSGYVYFNDDDTEIHKDLWNNIKNLENDFIYWNQNDTNNAERLNTKEVKIGTIDSHSFAVNYSICKNIRFQIDKYEADGIFATECFSISQNPLYINKVLSIYNSLR